MSDYEIQFCGDCLGDMVPNGTILRASPHETISPMDIVSIVLKRADGPFGEFMNTMGADFMGVCKLFLGTQTAKSGETIYLVAQLAPPAVSPIPASSIGAMHRVVDGNVPDDGSAAVSDDDQAAMALIAPFARGGTCKPIDPAWKPKMPAMTWDAAA